MPINSFLYPGAKVIPPFTVANSLRFNNGSSDNLTRSQSSGNRRTFTFSAWIKIADPALDPAQIIMENYADSGNYFIFYINNNPNEFSFFDYSSSATQLNFNASQEIRDPSAWYHVCLAIDTTQSTESNRVKFYINGSQVTAFDTASYPSQNLQTNVNNGNNHMLGRWGSQNGYGFDGYMAEVVFIDGQQLAPTSFGEFDSDTPTVWKPIDVTGLTFGTNGYYLDFEDSSALGSDAAGSNNFTVNNLTAIDQSTDTCTNNFATLNSLGHIQQGTLSEGNLKITSSSAYKIAPSTIAVSSGKWYVEHKITGSTPDAMVGVIDVEDYQTESSINYAGDKTNSVGYYKDGRKFIGNSASSYGASYTENDIIGIALDLDSGTKTIIFYKNGSSQGSINLPTGGIEQFYFLPSPYNATIEINFGSPSFSISSGNSDANGHGNFEYSVPSGFYSLNTKNLAEFG